LLWVTVPLPELRETLLLVDSEPPPKVILCPAVTLMLPEVLPTWPCTWTSLLAPPAMSRTVPEPPATTSPFGVPTVRVPPACKLMLPLLVKPLTSATVPTVRVLLSHRVRVPARLPASCPVTSLPAWLSSTSPPPSRSRSAVVNEPEFCVTPPLECNVVRPVT